MGCNPQHSARRHQPTHSLTCIPGTDTYLTQAFHRLISPIKGLILPWNKQAPFLGCFDRPQAVSTRGDHRCELLPFYSFFQVVWLQTLCQSSSGACSHTCVMAWDGMDCQGVQQAASAQGGCLSHCNGPCPRQLSGASPCEEAVRVWW